MTYRDHQRRLTWTVACAFTTLMGASACWAGSPQQATLIKHNGGRASGPVRYLAASKAYELTGEKATIRVPASEVARVILAQQPAQLAPAVAAVKSGYFAAAIAPLTAIKNDYEMFGPDVVAAQYLAVAYLGMGKSADAVRMCEEVLSSNPLAVKDGAFAGVYWDALLKEDKSATLLRILDDAIQTGTRDVSAVALVKRGDVLLGKGKGKEALLDGYLRTILLYQDVKSIQPEALYKAMKAHEAVNEPHYAEKWRKRLLSGYATSDYAKKLK